MDIQNIPLYDDIWQVFYSISFLKAFQMDKKYTTACKGIAIFLVIICHSAGKFGQGSFTLFTPLGGIGVAVFLLLSGYGLNEAWNNSPNAKAGTTWWGKRIITVWIPYMIIQIIAYWPFQKFEIMHFLLDVTLIRPLYQHGWYLQYAFMWYAVFFCVRRIKALDYHRIEIFIIISIILFFILREIKAEQSLSFLTGIILSENKKIREKLFKPKYGFAFIALGIACLALKQLPAIRSAPQIMMNVVQLCIKLPTGFGFIIICNMIFERRKWIETGLCAIGVISYELYLIHGYVLSAVPISFAGLVLFITISASLSICYWLLMKKMRTLLLKAACLR